MRANRVNTSGLTQTGLGRSQGIRRPASITGVATSAAPSLYLSRENIVSEHPRLAVEVRDAQQDYSSREIALDALTVISVCLNQMKKNLAQQRRTRDLDADFDRLKYRLKQASETQLFGRKVLSSNYKYSHSNMDFIYFHIPGLNIERERSEDEVISLFLAGKLISLPMRRVLGLFELRREIVATFGRQLFDVKFMPDGNIVVGMTDDEWRGWDSKAFVSGWGVRFASGPPVEMPVVPSEPVVQQVIGLSVDSPDVTQVIKRALDAIGRSKEYIQKGISVEVDRIQYLRGLVDDLEQRPLKAEFLANPRLSLSMVSYAFNGPSRANVIRMIQDTVGG